ncbi:MAG: hypothetical protein C0483_23195 [Pirellula sp.]|nr:hypothetical protein [Pirellula sp.]
MLVSLRFVRSSPSEFVSRASRRDSLPGAVSVRFVARRSAVLGSRRRYNAISCGRFRKSFGVSRMLAIASVVDRGSSVQAAVKVTSIRQE